MRIVRGAASNNNTLNFETANYKVEAKLNKNSFSLEESEIKSKNKFIANIPIINNLYNLIMKFIIKENGITTINILPVGLVIIYIIDKFYFRMLLPDITYFLYIIFLGIYVKRIKIDKIHGAEHMVLNYYLKHSKTSSVKNIRKESTACFACGTTHMIIILCFLFVLKIFIDDFILRYIISYLLSSNIILYSSQYKIIYNILTPLFWISGMVQKILFVSKPEKIHLEMGIAVINKLEQLENKIRK